MNIDQSVRASLLVNVSPVLLMLAALCLTILPSCDAGSAPVRNQQYANRLESRTGAHSRTQSWLLPGQRLNDLLYVSEEHGTVYVFGYPGGTLRGSLTGFSEPVGICVDSEQHVFVTDDGDATITEYAHGDAVPIGVLQEPLYSSPTDCSIDPQTGNLAVSNYGAGNVEIFPRLPSPGISPIEEWGEPQIVSDPQINLEFYCGYDSSGNLYIDGYNGLLQFAFAELPAGAQSFVNVTLPAKIKAYGAIRWDGSNVTIADYLTGVIYRIVINGTQGQIVGKTPLQGSYHIGGYSFYTAKGLTTLVGPNVEGDTVALWPYPTGGTPNKVIAIQGQPPSAVVSRGLP